MKPRLLKDTLAFIALIAVSLLLLGAPPIEVVHAETASELTAREINERLQQIGESYEVGEALNEEDADFVWEYGVIPDSQPVTRTSASINEQSTQYGTTATLTGTVWHDGTFNYNFGGNVTGRVISGPTPQSMTVTVSCQSYGLVGSSTVLTYSDNVSQTSYNSTVVNMNKSKNYSGVAAIYVINTQLDVTTASGDGFTINAS